MRISEHCFKLDYVLDTMRTPDEPLVDVGTTTLKRSDFISLGLHQHEVEATVSCMFVCITVCLLPHNIRNASHTFSKTLFASKLLQLYRLPIAVSK